jgi:hypothetical protein
METINYAIMFISVCCYLFVLYQMFVNAETVVGIVCLVGACVFGLGGLAAFIYGWMKAKEWEIVPVMAIWSGCIAINIVLAIIQVSTGG